MAIMNIGGEQDHFIEIEEINNEILAEVQYHVKWDENNTFVMAFDSESGRLKIQGPAPYAAQEQEEDICAAIDCYNNGFYWI